MPRAEAEIIWSKVRSGTGTGFDIWCGIISSPPFKFGLLGQMTLSSKRLQVVIMTMPNLFLQPLVSPSRAVSTSIHVTGLFVFAASIAWIPKITNPLHNGFGGSFKFLTIIALTLSTITYAVGFLADITLSKRMLTLKSILSLCATPLDVLISILYWGARAIDKKLVVPPGHEIPFVPDFGFHAVPAILLTIDLMLLSPPWPVRTYGTMMIGPIFVFVYWAWIELCFSVVGW